MNLRKYNETTGTWDIISSGNASGIMVTDPHFLDEGQTFKSVNQVLVDMDDKVEETKRNLSWVVLNGTIGGGGGGGGTTASIKLTDGSIVTNEGVNYLYSTQTKLTLHYLISSTKPNEKYNISVSLDGNTIISKQIGYSSVQGTLDIPNIAQFSNSASHSIVVTAENAEGISVTPYLLTVVESSISLESSVTSVTATIGLPYNITYKITNKVLGSETSLIVTNTTNGISKSYSVGKFTSVEPKLLDVNFFDLFDGATPTAGSSYTISAQATTSVDTQVINSDVITNKVVVEDGQTLVVLVDGVTTQADIEAGIEPTEFAQSGNISFSFTPYLAGVSIIYYALRIQRGTIINDIGNFDADSSNFNSNSYVLRGKAQVFSWSIPQEEMYLGDYKITFSITADRTAYDTFRDAFIKSETVKDKMSTDKTKTDKGSADKTKTETVKNEQGEDISKITAKVSDKVADKLVNQAVSNKSDTVEITVKSNDGNKAEQVEIEIPKKAVESIAKDTEADLVIKTDIGQVTLDNKTLETMAAEAEGDTVRLVVNGNTQLKEAQKSVLDIIGDRGHIFDFGAIISGKYIHDFRGGRAHITLPVPEKLKGKDIVIIHINDKGICEILNHTVETAGADRLIKFTTSHFSTFAVVEKTDAEKIIDKQNADKINSLIREAKLKATTSKTTKKSIKVKITGVKNSNSLIKEAKAMGYTVKYKFYRSTEKASKYTAKITKKSSVYINTKGRKGTKYYYKAKVLVYDGKTLIAQTELKQCRYGVRSWNK